MTIFEKYQNGTSFFDFQYLQATKDQIICSILIFFKNCHLSVASSVCVRVRVRVCVRVRVTII